VPKLNRHAREKRKTAGVCVVSPVGEKVELWRKVFVEEMSFEPGVEDRRNNGWWQWWWRKWRTHIVWDQMRVIVLPSAWHVIGRVGYEFFSGSLH